MLTKNQKQVLDFVKGFTDKHGYAPSLDEVRKHFKLASISTAHYYLSKLEKEGYLEREANQPRGSVVQPLDFSTLLAGTPSSLEFISVPLVGAANCGPAELLAEENIEAYIRVQKKLVSKKSGVFAVRAVGKSLNKANIKGKNIEEGDIVLVDSEDLNARNGDYVLSIIDGAANLKKFKIDRSQVLLVSESTENIKPILISPGDDWIINGKIVGVIKMTVRGV